MLREEFLGDPVMPWQIIVLRLIGATLLCLPLGYEREASDHSAGLRTHMLVGLAAAAYSLVTLHLVEIFADHGSSVRMDPLRLVEAVTGGVAFLAAGMIFLMRGKVHNLTTGAGLWLAAAIGVAAGNGLWGIAALCALLSVCIVALNTLWTDQDKS
jgi:putative Mg2+ transporter-C (MgtC) family protein